MDNGGVRPLSELAGLIRDFRRRSGLTQQEVAARAGMSLGGLRDMEQDRVKRPRGSTLRRLAEALELSPSETQELVRLGQLGPLLADDLRVQLLGPLAVLVDGTQVDLSSERQRTLLGVLALSPGVPVSLDALVDVMWGPQPPPTAVDLVQTQVSRLRRRLQPAHGKGKARAVLIATGGGYALRLDNNQLDLLAFQHLVDGARRDVKDGRSESALVAYQQAIDLWRGEPLADLPGLQSEPALAALARQLEMAVLEYADAAASIGRHDQVLMPLYRFAEANPLHESAHARLMAALASTGQQASALELFETLRRRLVDELGVDPGAEVREVHRAILRGDVDWSGSSGRAALVPPPRRPATAPDAWPVPGPVPGPVAAVPVAAVPTQLPVDLYGFTGREEQLRDLDAMLATAERRQPTATIIPALVGTAGVGKTALAVHWAHKVADRFPDGQLYADLGGSGSGSARSPVGPAEVLRGFLDALQVPAERIPSGLGDRACLYRSLLTGRRMLVLLDSVAEADEVRPLLPGSQRCLVLVTSRSWLPGLVATEGARPLAVDVLPVTEARMLLRHRLGRARVAAEPDAADEIIARCGRLPLALAIVAARAATNPRLPLAALAAELSDSTRVLDALGNGEAATDMRTVFSWSYRTLSAEAARLFRGLGTQRGPDVDAAAAAALLRVSPGQASPLLAELAHAHMITEIAPGRYTVHGLLRAYAAELTRRLRASAPPRPAALGRARVYGHNVSRARLHRLHGREAHGRIRGGANVWH